MLNTVVKPEDVFREEHEGIFYDAMNACLTDKIARFGDRVVVAWNVMLTKCEKMIKERAMFDQERCPKDSEIKQWLEQLDMVKMLKPYREAGWFCETVVGRGWVFATTPDQVKSVSEGHVITRDADFVSSNLG